MRSSDGLTVEQCWERNRLRPENKSNYLPYEEMLALFRQPELRQADIAELFGVQHTAVSKVYRKYFKRTMESEPIRLPLRHELERRYLAARRRRRASVPYGELLSLFENPEITLQTVAQVLGVSDRMAGVVYHKYFEPLIGMSARYGRIHERSRLEITSRRWRFERGSHLEIIAKSAEGAGLHVERLPRAYSHRWDVHRHALCIDGYRCRVHVRTRAVRRSHTTRSRERNHVRFHVPRGNPMGWVAYIVLADIPKKRRRIFVIPRYAIDRIAGTRDVNVWIRLSGRRYRRERHDWRRYENAWHLLEGE